MTDLTWRSQHQGSTVHWPLSGYQIVKAHVKGGVWWHNRIFGLQQHNSEKMFLIRKGLSHKSLLQVESSIGIEWVEFVNKCWESKIFLRNVWNLDKSYFKTEPLTLYLLKLKSWKSLLQLSNKTCHINHHFHRNLKQKIFAKRSKIVWLQLLFDQVQDAAAINTLDFLLKTCSA